MRTQAVVLFALVLAAGASAPAVAGPCLTCNGPLGPVTTGWWDERPLSPAARVARAPRVDAGDRFGAPALAVVWEERALGSGEITLAVGDDGGCAWRLLPVAASAADERDPDVAILPTLDFVAVSFVRDNQPWVTVSQDGGASFAAPEMIAQVPAAVDADGPPRLSLILIDQAIHLHVVWTSAGALFHARSLTGGAPGSWQGAARPLSAGFAGYSLFSSPDVAADSRSADAALHSSVNVVMAAIGPGAFGPEIFVVRSNDSGATFFGDPAIPASRDIPRRVNDTNVLPVVPRLRHPIIDGNDDGSGILKAWNAVAWSDGPDPGSQCGLDARSEEGSGPTVISDWNDPPASGDVSMVDPSAAAALSVVPNPLERPPAADFHLFVEDSGVGAGRELMATRGTLDAAKIPSPSLFCAAYRLTGTDPARALGEVYAGSASADEDLSHVFLVWIDDRDGSPRVWFKRTDTWTAEPTLVSAVPGACAAGGGIALGWIAPAAPPHCDVRHYRIDYGTSPGVYDFSVAGPGTSRALTGLSPGVRYYARVTTVDEACNEAAAGEVSAVAADCSSVPLCPNGVDGSLRAVRSPGRDVQLSWQPAVVDALHDPASSYEIWRSLSRGQDGYGLLAATAAEALSDVGAAGASSPAPRLYYRIVARNACGSSGDEPPQ